MRRKLLKRSIDTIVRGKKLPEPKIKPTIEIKPIIYKQDAVVDKRKGISGHKKNRFKIFGYIGLGLVLLVLLAGKPVKNIYALYSLLSDGKYLVLFQNNAELRGGGGFVGSFAVVDILDKKIKSYYFESNIYKKDNAFAKITDNSLPPEFQEVLGKDWALTLRDANYQADFRDASKSVAQLYQAEYNHNINGLIGLNASAISQLLKLTGPVEIPQDNITVNSDNFFDILQNQIQVDYFKDDTNKLINEPKTILKDMVPLVLNKLKNVSPLTLYNFFISQIREKQILFWFSDNRQNIVEKNNWAGRVVGSNDEYVYVSNANIGGQKTSILTNQTINYFGPSVSSIRREVNITRFHQGGSSFNADVENKNYLKLYIPQGSKIISIENNGQSLSDQDISIDSEFGKTVVGLWASTKPYQTTLIKIIFDLPKYINKGTILYQKQPGLVSERLKIQFGRFIKFNQVVKRDKII